MNLWRIQNLLTKVPNIIRRSQTRKVLQESCVTRVFHQHQSPRDLRQAPIGGVLWPSDSFTNAFRCALRSVTSNNLVNLTTYTGDMGKTAGFLRCPSTFRRDSGQKTAGGNPPVAGFYWQPCVRRPCLMLAGLIIRLRRHSMPRSSVAWPGNSTILGINSFDFHQGMFIGDRPNSLERDWADWNETSVLFSGCLIWENDEIQHWRNMSHVLARARDVSYRVVNTNLLFRTAKPFHLLEIWTNPTIMKPCSC